MHCSGTCFSYFAFCITSFCLCAYNPTSVFPKVFLRTVAPWDFPIEKGSLVKPGCEGGILPLPLLCPWVLPAVKKYFWFCHPRFFSRHI